MPLFRSSTDVPWGTYALHERLELKFVSVLSHRVNLINESTRIHDKYDEERRTNSRVLKPPRLSNIT
jgi:hypothetical protein